MKTALYLTAWGLMEVFGLNPHNYAGRMPVGFLTSVTESDLEKLCADIVTDGATEIARKTERPVMRQNIGGDSLTTGQVYDVELWPLVNRINGELREKLQTVDPRHDFPKLHARKFEPRRVMPGIYAVDFE